MMNMVCKCSKARRLVFTGPATCWALAHLPVVRKRSGKSASVSNQAAAGVSCTR